MVSPKVQKMCVVIVVVFLIGILAYETIIREPEVLDSTIISSSTETAGQDILDLVEKLRAISIDQNFFSDPMFMNLKDFSQNIFPESAGRPNPFAAIGVDMVSQPQIQATSTGAR
jgi:hypothetical protein